MEDKTKKPEDEKTDGTPPETPQEKPQDAPQDEEKPEGEEVPAEEEKPPEDAEKPEDEPAEPAENADKPPELSEADKLKEENFRLKTQLEAMKIGFSPDVIEDAVVLAENIVKRDGGEITAALEAVAKKYPDWKLDGKSGGKPGFKVGADTSKKSAPNDDRISKAFGLKKKG